MPVTTRFRFKGLDIDLDIEPYSESERLVYYYFTVYKSKTKQYDYKLIVDRDTPLSSILELLYNQLTIELENKQILRLEKQL